MIIKRKLTDLDYVEIYAKNLKINPELFKQQKMFIESQMKSSRSFFKNLFGNNFKKKAREYLRKMGKL